MARLTRTQKYADLRSQMETDRETSLQTDNDLSNATKILEDHHISVTDLPKPVEMGELKVEAVSPVIAIEEITEPEKAATVAEEVKEPSKEPVIEVKEPVKEEPVQAVETVKEQEPVKEEEPVQTVTPINDSYLTETLQEVAEYNSGKGLPTAAEVSNKIIGEIRGHDSESEDSFDPSLNLDLKNVLTDLEPEPVKDDTHVAVQKTTLDKEVADYQKDNEEKKEQKVTKVELGKTKIVTKLSKELVAPEVDTKTPTGSGSVLLNETTPYKLTDEDDYEEKPNRILNFILVVLIIVLLCVLGFIVYLILVAHGIL